MKRFPHSFRTLLTGLCATLLLCSLSANAHAVFTDTLPQGVMLIDESFVASWLGERWDNDGNRAELLDEIERYDPGGGLQGIIRPEPEATYMVLVNKLQFGILDNLSFGIGIPVVLYTHVDPKLNWISGDYQSNIGREYSAEDFWDWAQSMGQSKPGSWTGNKGKLSDIVLGLRFRWTDYIDAFQFAEVQGAVSVFGAIPTGSNADPEEVASAGTSMWDLSTQGDLAFHISFDKTFERHLDGRLILGLDLFYEVFFDRSLTSPTGKIHPLLKNFAPYIGDTYTVNPGDFAGFSFEVDVVPYKGPVLDTWLTRGKKTQKNQTDLDQRFPPIITVGFNYSFTHVQQTDYKSDFPLWDYDQEDLWRPGYKNALTGKVSFSFLRLGAPFNLYFHYRTLRLIPGKNARAPDMVTAGIQIPVPLIGW